MAKSPLYLPKRTPQEFPSSFGKDNAEFARSFGLLADLINKAGPDSEAFALYLSTCRNAYLTINGMFYDIRELFGTVSPQFGLFGLLQMARGGAFESIVDTLDEISLTFSAFDEKSACWLRRKELKNKLDRLLEGYPFLDRIDLNAILYEVVNQDEHCSLASVLQFLVFDINEDDQQRCLLNCLIETRNQLFEVLKCVRTIGELGHVAKNLIVPEATNGQRNLLVEKYSIPDSLKKKCLDFYKWLNLSAEKKEMVLINQACRKSENDLFSPQLRNYTGYDLLIHSDEVDEIYEFFKIFSLKLQAAVTVAYESLNKSFRPNIGKKPLPSPFIIDLSILPTSTPDLQNSVVASAQRYSNQPIEQIVIAVASPPFSSSNILEVNARYKDDEIRRIAIEWACLAIESAVGKAQLVVFPELFIPEGSISVVCDLARKSDIGVICGIEGIWNTSGLYSCQTSVVIPGVAQEFRQFKYHRSNYESSNFETKGGQLCFHQSKIGSFSVILCSDFREYDVISAIESQPFLDYVIVCCCNPYTKLWEHMAISDAARLNCFVIISNWSSEKDEYGYGLGSVCVAPVRAIESNAYSPAKSVMTLSLPNHNDEVKGSLSFYDLDLGALFRDREKPHKTNLSPPSRRLSINKYKARTA